MERKNTGGRRPNLTQAIRTLTAKGRKKAKEHSLRNAGQKEAQAYAVKRLDEVWFRIVRQGDARRSVNRFLYAPLALNGAKVASRRQEAPSPNDLDPTLAGPDGGVQDDQESGSPPVDEDAPATTELPNFPAASPEPEPAGPETSRRRSRAQPVAPPVAHQTRARSRLHPAKVPEPTPAPTARRKRAPVAKAKSSAATLEAVAESSPHATHDEFVAHSEDESDIEVNVLVDSGASIAPHRTNPEAFFLC